MYLYKLVQARFNYNYSCNYRLTEIQYRCTLTVIFSFVFSRRSDLDLVPYELAKYCPTVQIKTPTSQTSSFINYQMLNCCSLSIETPAHETYTYRTVRT